MQFLLSLLSVSISSARSNRLVRRAGHAAPASLSDPERLESRELLAVATPPRFSGKDTTDFYMKPALREGDPVNPQWNMEKIRAADVWWVYDGNPKSVVAVEDYGVDYRHEDFGGSAITQGQFWDFGKIFAPDGINFEFSKKGRDDFHDPVNPPRKDTLDPNWNAHTLPDQGEYFGNIGAGIIGAKTNNNLGVAGINWDVQIYSSKVVVNDTTNHDWIAKRANRTIQYLRLGKIDGIQDNPNPQPIRAVSFGYCSKTDYQDIFHLFVPVPETAADLAGHYDFVALGKGIQQLTQTPAMPNGDATQGILVTVPTGDYGKTWPTKYYREGTWAKWTPWTTWPANPNSQLVPVQNRVSTSNGHLPPVKGTTLGPSGFYSPGDPDNVIAVAATDINDVPWVGNADNPIDIYAPGVNIVSIGDQPQTFDVSSGTRQAQAHVAGAIALLYDVAQQHGFTPTYHQIREAIIEGGDDIGAGKPRLNVVNSIKYLSLFAGKDLTRRPDPLGTSVQLTGGSGLEGDAGVSQAVFTLTLTKTIDAPITIGVRVADGTASVADGDYTSPAADGVVQVTIPAGKTAATFTVNINGDRRYEPDERIEASLVAMPGNVTPVIGFATAQWTILNDDTLPKVSVANASGMEGSASQAGRVRVVATLDKPSAVPVTVQYSVINGTAIAGVDYTPPPSRVVTFPANRTTMPIDIQLIGNADAQADRTFQVRLDAVVNADPAAAGSNAILTIVDDDRILVGIQPVVQAAPTTGTATMLFTVTLSRAPTLAEGSVQISYRTIDGLGAAGAVAGLDYQSTAGSLVFSPGETSKTIAVAVLARRPGQRYPKSFSMEVSGVSGAGWLAGGVSSRSVLGRIS